jgi:hypothetical protein
MWGFLFRHRLGPVATVVTLTAVLSILLAPETSAQLVGAQLSIINKPKPASNPAFDPTNPGAMTALPEIQIAQAPAVESRAAEPPRPKTLRLAAPTLPSSSEASPTRVSAPVAPTPAQTISNGPPPQKQVELAQVATEEVGADDVQLAQSVPLGTTMLRQVRRSGTNLAAAAPKPGAGKLDVLALHICQAAPTWRDETRTWLRESYPDRQETTARAVQLLQTAAAIKGCPQQAISDFVGLAKIETCVIYPIDAVCLRKFNVPAGVQAFDLQPQGGIIYPGMRPVTPGDTRIKGGVGVKYNDALPASGDAISGLVEFKTPVPNGVWRVILVSGKRPLAQATATSFGSAFTANNQLYEIMTVGPDRWIPRGAFSNLSPSEAFTPQLVLPGSAPAIVFDVNVLNGELLLEFPQGAELSIVYIEPVDQPSSFVLDGAATVATQTPDGCLAQQEAIDRVANQIQSSPPPPPPPPRSPPPGCAVGNCSGPVSKS